MILKERKALLKQIVLEEKHFSNDIYIYRLLETDNLDYLIKKLDDTKIACYKPVYEVKELSSEEYFIYLLTAFIGYFRREFPYLCYYERIIWSNIFANHTNGLFLLSKKDYHNTDNLSYFLYEMKKSIISNTLETLKGSYKESKIIRDYFKEFNINFDTFDFNNKKDIDNLFDAIKKLTEFNFTHPQIFYLFHSPNIIDQPKNINDREEHLRNCLLANQVLIETLIKKTPLIKYKDVERFLSSYN